VEVHPAGTDVVKGPSIVGGFQGSRMLYVRARTAPKVIAKASQAGT
jgi:hypothetical protein